MIIIKISPKCEIEIQVSPEGSIGNYESIPIKLNNKSSDEMSNEMLDFVKKRAGIDIKKREEAEVPQIKNIENIKNTGFVTQEGVVV